MVAYERWQDAVAAVRSTLRPATTTQRRLARSARVDLARGTPEIVAAELLKIALHDALHLPPPRQAVARDWSRIVELCRRCELEPPPRPEHRTVAAAWVRWLQGLLDVAALRRMRLSAGDLVTVRGRGALVCEISSLAATGKVNFRGADPPAHAADLTVRSRAGESDDRVEQLREGVTRRMRMRQRTVPPLGTEDLARLERHVVTGRSGPHEVQRLHDVVTLGSGDAEIVRLLAERPALLRRTAATPTFWVVRGNGFGARCAPSFMVASRDGEDLGWVAVLCAHPSDVDVVRDGRPVGRLARAVDRIEAWRNWLAGNLDSARSELPQVRADVPAIVLIGQARYETARQRDVAADLAARKQIEVHPYDWLLEIT